ncbi:MAG TPA: site-2 protease family protein [Kiritimatiellia bacterium]|nr:site-2 protease family protein [Kiritimatiellia bacterium]HMP32874.1 site-2 protease family protein [Kiritimatiellia bacterium]
MFIQAAFDNLPFFISWVMIITFSICIHEFAHARIALALGDDTAASNGHLSLNPLVQMGWTSLLMLVLIGIAWGAVPVNPRRLGLVGHAKVAFAGPAANLILCILCSVAAGVVGVFTSSTFIEGFLLMAAMANAVLFLFNLLPIPMFDGWTVLALFVPALARIDVRQVSGYSWMALIVIWTTGLMDRIWDAGALASRIIQGAVIGILM